MDAKRRRFALRGPIIEIVVGIVMSFFIAWLFLSWLAGEAIGQPRYYSPVAYNECLPRSMQEVTDHLSQEGREALAIINTNRTVVDFVIVSERETALGVFHITAQAERFYPGDLWEQLAVLYSDEGPQRQAEEWRDLVGVVRRRAESDGCTGQCLTVALALANSAPTHVLEWGIKHDWDSVDLCQEYMGQRPDSEHRQRRCERLRDL